MLKKKQGTGGGAVELLRCKRKSVGDEVENRGPSIVPIAALM